MDEPTLMSQVDDTDASAEKSDTNEVLDSALGSEEVKKPMEVDGNVEPSTSAEPAVTPDAPESRDEEVDPPVELEQEDAGKADVTMSEVDPVEQMSFSKDDSVMDETLNETAQTDVADSSDFVEKSINISQLNVEHQDDESNDAFNAMKESETDALQESRDELEEPKEEPVDTPEDSQDQPDDSQDKIEEPQEQSDQKEPGHQSEPENEVEETEEPERNHSEEVENPPGGSEEQPDDPMESEVPPDSAKDQEKSPDPQEEQQETREEPKSAEDSEAAEATEPTSNDKTQEEESAKDPEDDNQMETDENVGEQEKTDGEAQAETEESRDMGTGTTDFDNLMNDDEGLMGPPADVYKPQIEDAEEIPEDDTTNETETTNDGEGIDENVCLLGDETEIAEGDKEGASQVEDVAEDEEPEATSAEKETAEEQEPTAGDEVMEVDGEKDQEGEEPEPEEQEPEEEPEPVEEDHTRPLKENEIREIHGELAEESCLNCENVTKCQYRLLEESGEIKFLCTFNCVKEHREDNPDKYSLTQKRVKITEIPPAEHDCSKCGETKSCKYMYRITVYTVVSRDPPPPAEGEELPEDPPEPITETVQSIESRYLCEEACLKDTIGDNTEKYVVKEVKRRSGRVREPPKHLRIEEEQEVPKIIARSDADVEAARLDRDASFIRRCAQCFIPVNFSAKTVQWETFDFCNEKCLGAYQSLIGAACVHCNQVVPVAAIGKLCVRFGSDIKQFCTTQCLNDFKKNHQPCSLCSKNLRKDVGETDAVVKRGNNNFCDTTCAKRYEDLINPKKRQPPYLCSVCNIKKSPKIHVLLDGNVHRFCSTPCFSAFKFVNNVAPDQCDMCTKYFERRLSDSHTIYLGSDRKMFCSRECMCFYITKTRSIWQCNWCKVSKYSFDMIQFSHGSKKMCSLNCKSLSEVSTNAQTKKRIKCDHCKIQKQPQYHLSMSDATIRNFCTYQCVLGFQGQFSRMKAAGEIPDVVPAGTAKRIIQPAPQQQTKQPVISLVQSLSTRRGRPPYNPTRRTGSPIPVPELTVQLERITDLSSSRVKISSMTSLKGKPSWTAIPTTAPPVRVEHKTQVVTIPPLPKPVGNKSTMCKAITLNKAISCIPETAEVECQTEDWLEQRIVVPVPIPIYVPQPMYMYNMPTIIPVPIPLPIPVPVFVPTTRNSANGIMKEIKKIQEKMPTDPYEAELLMMAEMVAGDKKREETDSDSDENNDMEYGDGMEHNSSFNEDLVQMAFKMAGNDFDEPPVDLENEMTANTISQSTNAYGEEMDPHSLHHHQLLLLQQQRDAAAAMQNRGRKRIQTPTKPANNRNAAPNKRIKREMEVMQPEIPREPAEKPDANMCLKYTFGVNAWKQWVATKNADFEKSSIRRKPIKSEILQLTADELNYSLCMFVKEVRKPNGSEYAPDTIYYLVLGIQQYLYENGRIDNIFTDRYYEQFTDCLDEVAKKFSVLYNDSQYIVTRVEEEHLWECKQLGAHSPHVLLSTLMFFNTKHFNLVTVDEHMELSFSHIMKHWKRNPNQPGATKVPGSRNVLLRFYPPQSSLEANSRKKKVYEQQENEDNPLRCPVKLYEFYLSKCPESVKTRNDVFYLQPERSCVPDSPVWYSTQPLSREALSKMLHRVKMVKEINIALLTS